jgi:hypothetical protein
MRNGLGFFSTYEIEDVFHFLGKNRIDKRILDLKDKPPMGMRLEDFLVKDSHISCRGTLLIFSLLLKWFKETDFIIYLYNRSKAYSEENYFETEKMKNIFQECNESMTRLIKSSPDKKEYWLSQKLNPFWIDYHFFITIIVAELMKFKKYESDKNIERTLEEIFNFYYLKSETITARIKADIYLWPNKGLSNLVFSKMQTFYKSKKESSKLIDTIEKRNLLGWR